MKLHSWTASTACVTVASAIGGGLQGVLALRPGFVFFSGVSTESDDAVERGLSQELSAPTDPSFLHFPCWRCKKKTPPPSPPPSPLQVPATREDALAALGIDDKGRPTDPNAAAKQRRKKKKIKKKGLVISAPTNVHLPSDFLHANKLVTLQAYRERMRSSAGSSSTAENQEGDEEAGSSTSHSDPGSPSTTHSTITPSTTPSTSRSSTPVVEIHEPADKAFLRKEGAGQDAGSRSATPVAGASPSASSTSL
ncbi:hypothetical protein ACSSS7_004316 [Eimeria intestinalis]